MLNDKELKKIRTLLPPNSYQRIADMLTLNKETVRKALTQKVRYRKDVIDMAFTVIENHAQYIEQLKQKIKAL